MVWLFTYTWWDVIAYFYLVPERSGSSAFPSWTLRIPRVRTRSVTSLLCIPGVLCYLHVSFALICTRVCVRTMLYHASSPFLVLPERCTSGSRGFFIFAFDLEWAFGIILCAFAVFSRLIEPWGCAGITTKTARLQTNRQASLCNLTKITFFPFLVDLARKNWYSATASEDQLGLLNVKSARPMVLRFSSFFLFRTRTLH